MKIYLFIVSLFCLLSFSVIAEEEVCGLDSTGVFGEFDAINKLSLELSPVLLEMNMAELDKLDDKYHIPISLFEGFQGVAEIGQGVNANPPFGYNFFTASVGEENVYGDGASGYRNYIRHLTYIKDAVLLSHAMNLWGPYDQCEKECRNSTNIDACMENNCRELYDDLQAAYSDVEEYRKDINDISPLDIDLTQLLDTYDDVTLPEHLQSYVEQAEKYNLMTQMITTQDTDKALEILANNTQDYTIEEKIALVSEFGQVFSDGYDYQRAAEDRTDAIEGGDLLSAAYNRIFAHEGEPSAGVCRDIASYQGRMLQTMGMDHVYVIAYGTHGGGHATVYSEDPDTGTTYKFNYDNTQATDATGTKALEQEWDAALSYQIYEVDGGKLATIRSERAQVLLEGLKGKNVLEENIPFYQRPPGNSVNSVEVLRAGNVVGRGFTATDSLGKQYVGFGLTGEIDESFLEGSVGGGLAQIKYAKEEGPFHGQTQEKSDLIGYINLDLKAKADIEVDKVKITPFVGVNAEGAVNLAGIAKDTPGMGYFTTFETGVESEISLGDAGRLDVDAKVVGAPGFTDIRKAGAFDLSIMEVSFDHAEVNIDYEQQMRGDMTTIASTGLYVDNFGPIITQSIGVKSDKGKATIGVTAPIDGEDRPNFSYVAPELSADAEVYFDDNTTGWMEISYLPTDEYFEAGIGLKIELK